MHISTKQRLELSGEIFLLEPRKRSEIFFFKSAFLSLSFSCTSFWVRMLLYMLASSMHVLYRLFLLSEMICCWFSLSKLVGGGGVFSRKDCMLLIMLNLFSIFKSLSCYSEFVLVEGFFTWWCGKYWLSSWTRIAFSSAFFLKFLSPSFSPREGSKVLCILVVIVYCLPSKPWSDSTNITMVNTLHRLLDAMVIQLWWQWAGVILSVGPQVISFISFFGGLVTWDKLVVYETGY